MSKLVYKALETIPEFQQAWVDIEEPIRLSTIDITVATFTYGLGYPYANAFGDDMEFYLTEEDAEAGNNPITDTDNLPEYEMFPTTPSAYIRGRDVYNGYVRLCPRTIPIKYPILWGKIIIIQPELEEAEVLAQKSQEVTENPSYGVKGLIPNWER